MNVGKTAHHGHGLTPAGKKVFDKPMPNSEPKLRAVFDKLKAKFGTVLVIVDQPASIGALLLTVARDAGCEVAYLPGLAMRRVADLYPGEAKTNAKDAVVIADAARTMPHTLRSLELTDEITAELTVLTGFAQAAHCQRPDIARDPRPSPPHARAAGPVLITQVSGVSGPLDGVRPGHVDPAAAASRGTYAIRAAGAAPPPT
ncbi:IS110 family transposase [Streptomyces virginiae]|uniref:IS110 family transposase n=1 Tax=Streptomyces virginiae TaxID=1961 RepID=UPI00365FBA0C